MGDDPLSNNWQKWNWPKINVDDFLKHQIFGYWDRGTDEGSKMARVSIEKKRAYILGYSATSILKWMGKNGWSVEDATTVVRKLATGLVSHNTVTTGLADGRSATYGVGIAEPSPSQIRELEEARDGDGEAKEEEEENDTSHLQKLSDNAEITKLRAKVNLLEERLEEVAAAQPRKVHITIQTEKKIVELKEHIHPIFEEVMFHVNCGDNVMLVGPKGCGKTKLCEQVAAALGREHGAISLSGGVTESKLFGRLVPNITTGKSEWHSTPFTEACEKGHVFLLDESDGGDPNVMLSLNMVLANRKLVLDRPKNPIVDIHDDFLCLAAANTWGNGADRQYVGRNQMDGAFSERFVQLSMDYDENLERALCPNHPKLVDRLLEYRGRCRTNRLERSISTRFLLRAYNWMLHGKDQDFIDKRLFAGWRADEVTKVRGW